MPNGFHGKKSEWKRLTAPLKTIDKGLKRFASEHGLDLLRDTKNWPERSFRWGSPTERLIQIYLADESELTWTLWICASEDRADGRYWKREFLKKEVLIEELADNLPDLLNEAHSRVKAWTASDLSKV